MYTGTPAAMIDALPGLMSNLKMMHTIARYYSTSERMTVLLSKITTQIIRKCKEYILAPGKIWDQEKPQLIANMQLAIRLGEEYKAQY